MQYKPLFDRLLIEPIAEEEIVNGIFVPPTSSNFKKAKVLAAGAGKPGQPMTVKEGDTICYRKDDAMAITLDDNEFFVLYEKDAFLLKEKITASENY